MIAYEIWMIGIPATNLTTIRPCCNYMECISNTLMIYPDICVWIVIIYSKHLRASRIMNQSNTIVRSRNCCHGATYIWFEMDRNIKAVTGLWAEQSLNSLLIFCNEPAWVVTYINRNFNNHTVSNNKTSLNDILYTRFVLIPNSIVIYCDQIICK